MPKARIYIVEDETLIAMEIKDRLEALGYEVCGTAGRGEDAIASIADLRPDLVLMDIMLAGEMDGIRTAQVVSGYGIPVIYLTAYSDEKTLERAKLTDPYGYLLKPFGESELRTTIEVALYKHQADRKMRESELRYRTLSDAAFEGIGMVDQDGVILDVNKRLSEMLGFDPSELIGRKALETVAPECREDVRRHMESRSEEVYQFVLLRKDGRRVPAEGQGRIMERDGKKIRVSAIQDISERKQAEEALRSALASAQEAKNKTEAIIAAMGDGISIEDRNLRIVYQNRVHKELIGDFTGDFCYRAYHNRESVCEACPMEQTFRDGAVRTAVRTVERGGRTHHLEITVSPLPDASGRIVAGVEIVRDVTARLQLAEQLRRSEERLRLVMENINEIIYTVSFEDDPTRGTVEIMSGSVARGLGYTLDEFRQDRTLWRSLIHPDDVERISIDTGRILQSGESGTRTYRMKPRASEDYRWYEDTLVPRSEDGRVTGFFGVARDITKRREAEELVRQYYATQVAVNELLRQSLSDLPLAKILQHALDHILSVDWLSTDSLGCIFLFSPDRNELVMAAQKNLDPRIVEACSAIAPGRCLCGRAALSHEAVFVDHIDDRHEVSVCDVHPHGHYCVPILHADSLLGVLNIYVKHGHQQQERDLQFLQTVTRTLAVIIRRKQMEDDRTKLHQELQELFIQVARSQHEWRDTFDSITDMISIYDEDHRILKLNRAFAGQFKREPRELIGKKCEDLMRESPDPVLNCSHHLSRPENLPISEEVGDARTGRVLLISTFPVVFPGDRKRGTIQIVRDITSEREKEMRLIMSERLASLGQMASGVAHEINNPLSAVAACTEGLLSRVKAKRYDEEFFTNYLTIMQEEIARCKKITTSMLSIVQQTSYVRGTVNVNEALDKTLEIIGLQGRLKTSRVVREFDQALPLVHGSEGELKQVFLAIISNAFDAMKDSGVVTIRTGAAEGRVVIKISDTGPGVPLENVYKVFDPFFSTKTDQGGTGLGLSIARKIITSHRGTIELESRPGVGASFIISLPAATPEQAALS